MLLIKSMYIYGHFFLFDYKNIATLSQAVNIEKRLDYCRVRTLSSFSNFMTFHDLFYDYF